MTSSEAPCAKRSSNVTSVTESGIYVILQLSTGLHYVGSAVQLKRRWDRHRSDLMAARHHNQKLQRAWDKYGESDFRFDVAEECSPESLVEREQYWLDNTRPFFNILRIAYSAIGYKHTAEAKMKMGERSRLAWAATSVEERTRRAANHAKKICGSVHTESTRRKMSESHKGKALTEAQLFNLTLSRNPESVAKRADAISRWYVVTNPDGVELEVKNMSAFCRSNDLCQSSMNSLARGKGKQHKGWKCRLRDEK